MIKGGIILSDMDNQVKAEIWKHPPALLPENPAIAEPLSVITFLGRETDDSRMEQAVNAMFEKLWKNSV